MEGREREGKKRVKILRGKGIRKGGREEKIRTHGRKETGRRERKWSRMGVEREEKEKKRKRGGKNIRKRERKRGRRKKKCIWYTREWRKWIILEDKKRGGKMRK